MGPGSFDPGNALMSAPASSASLMLQWGRGLSTPEMACAPLPPVRSDTLQWGRGLSTPEMRRAAHQLAVDSAASMGPGSFDPGNNTPATASR